MRETTVQIDGMMSIFDGAGVEKQIKRRDGVVRVAANFLSGTATIVYDETLVAPNDIKTFVADCGYHCRGEVMPAHVCEPGRPNGAPTVRAKAEDHAGHKAEAMSPDKAEMAQEMGHGAGKDIDGMVRDMRNRLLVTLVLTISIYLYAPMFVKLTGVVLPMPFGLSKDVLMFLLATPAVFYGGWVFYIGAWRALKNGVANMAVLVSLSVLAGYLFSVGATFSLGTTTTPFDMVVLNDLDRFHLAADVIDRVPALGPRAANAQQAIRDKLIEHKQYIARHGEDMPEIRNWRWSPGTAAKRSRGRSAS